MEIRNEYELIEIIKDKSLEEVKICFRECNVRPIKFNYLNNVLLHLIINNGVFEVIKFIIEERQKENRGYSINNTEALFCSVEYSNFEIANLLLRCGEEITNTNSNSENIIEYLLRVDKLSSTNLSFILNITKDLSLVSNKVLFKLFGNPGYYATSIDIILNYKFTIKKENIVNTLIIAKKRLPMSGKEIQNYISNNLISAINFNIKNENGSTLFLHTITSSSSLNTIQKIISYSKDNDILLNLNEKNNDGNYPLLTVIGNDESLLELLIAYAKENNIILSINEGDNEGIYPLLKIINSNNNINNIYFINKMYEQLKLLINYARENKLILEMNCKDKNGNHPFLNLLKYGYNRILSHKYTMFEMCKLLIDYAKESKYILNLNEKDTNGNFLISIISDYCYENDLKIKLIQLITEYATEFNIKLELVEKNNKGEFILSETIYSYELFKLLINYAENNNIIQEVYKNVSLLFVKGIKNDYSSIIELLLKTAQKHNITIDLNEKIDSDERSLFHYAVIFGEYYIFNLIQNYAKEYNMKLHINEVDKYGNYPLLMAVQSNSHRYKSIEKVKFLIEYANENNIVLNMDYRLFLSTIANKENCLYIIQLLINYAIEHSIDVKINEENNDGDYALLKAVSYGDLNILQLLKNFAKENNIVLEINKKNKNGDYPLLKGSENIEILQWLINYGKENNIMLELNEKNKYGDYPLLKMARKDQNFRLLLDYANENNIILTINDKNNSGRYPLLNGIKNIEFDKLLMNYATENNIVLLINDKDYDGDFPLYLATSFYDPDPELVKLLIEYAQKNNILLDLNLKNNGDNSLFTVMKDLYYSSNKEKNKKKRIIQLLVNYATENNILLNIGERKDESYSITAQSIFEFAIYKNNDYEIFKLIIDYAQNNKMILPLFKNHYRNGNNLLLYAIFHCKNSQIIKRIFDIARQHNIIYDLTNTSNYYGPLYYGVELNDAELVQMILQYAKDNHTILKVERAFYLAVDIKNVEMIKSIMEYSKENNIILEINHVHYSEHYPLFNNRKNIEITKLLMDYAKENGILLNLNRKSDKRKSSLLYQIKNNNVEMVRLFMQYAKENHTVLELNATDENGNYPFLQAMRKSHKKMIQLLIDYANENNIIFEINKYNKQGNFPLLFAIRKNNVEVVKLLIDYAKSHHISLNVHHLDFYNEHVVIYPEDKDKIKSNTNEITQLLLQYKNYLYGKNK
ncbi:hypothetical protein PIROE2DRAFT_60337 [Piromyces sp. E2]|nr:hypothetical protein PIROE2DRAFT_60337 [Piromyces sp. E2]|eukprot:OUM64919.1 hypothetical protein PIROE2DRAFT_60337 [Piromyces sp. E2]